MSRLHVLVAIDPYSAQRPARGVDATQEHREDVVARFYSSLGHSKIYSNFGVNTRRYFTNFKILSVYPFQMEKLYR